MNKTIYNPKEDHSMYIDANVICRLFVICEKALYNCNDVISLIYEEITSDDYSGDSINIDLPGEINSYIGPFNIRLRDRVFSITIEFHC